MQTWGNHDHNQDSEHTCPAPKVSLCLSLLALILPCPLPFTATHLFYVTIGQFAFFRLLLKLNHTVYTLYLLLLSIIILRVTLLIACINISLLFSVEQYFIVWIYHNLFIHSSVMMFGLFPNKAIMNIIVQA